MTKEQIWHHTLDKNFQNVPLSASIAMQRYADQETQSLRSRVAVLEAALKAIRELCGYNSIFYLDHMDKIESIATEALKQK